METSKKAAEILWKLIGQDRPVVLATVRENGVAARTVNLYFFENNVYFITENDSNKYQQLCKNPQAAFALDAIQITGQAELLPHPSDPANQNFASAIEALLPAQFDRYRNRPEMRLVRVAPENASFIQLDNGTGYAIDFAGDKAFPIKIEM